ncbi:GGDEF domain-containing protein [Arenimonas terrae]|jgi:diguanylate cyclase (GGDEF)-like protein|uniref:diguanylate cyclase n=1 Tax=Arenimonas terrae TaxID=2546226 RepID=A0A5C4RWU0_9GAMM|nr:GGDEF domain-containing protein [Arenimonas terrae]TNJ35733.1 diguanylate cyclase [Arenimonas terrae]
MPPLRPRTLSRLLALAGATAAAPASAVGHDLVHGALWFTLGAAVSVALVMMLSSRVLRERVAPRSAWIPFAGVALVVLLVGSALAWYAPWLGLAIALPVAGWGLWLVDRMARRMRSLLDERDRARAEAKRAKQDSERDPLTGALNRGAWHKRLEQLTENHREDNGQAKPLSVLFFDIDLFKLINDSLGHGVGDDCLRAVARTVGEELRGGDVMGRVGGEEFAVVLPGARRIHAIAVAERIRTAVQSRCHTVGEEVVELTVSIGAAEYLGADESLEALVERADRAMYLAKDSGRNMVVADAGTPS